MDNDRTDAICEAEARKAKATEIKIIVVGMVLRESCDRSLVRSKVPPA